MIDLKTKSELVQKLCQVVLEIISDLKGETGGVGPSPKLPTFQIHEGNLKAVYEDNSFVNLGRVVPEAPNIDYQRVLKECLDRIVLPEPEPINVDYIAELAAKLVQVPSTKLTNAEQVDIAKMAVAYILQNKLFPEPKTIVKDNSLEINSMNGAITELIEDRNKVHGDILALQGAVKEIPTEDALIKTIAAEVLSKIPAPKAVEVKQGERGPEGPQGKSGLPEHVTLNSYTKDVRNTAKDAIADLPVGDGLQTFTIVALGASTNFIDKHRSTRELTVQKENGVVRILEDKKITADYPPLSGPLNIIFTPDTDKITVYGTGIPAQEVQWKLIVTRYG